MNEKILLLIDVGNTNTHFQVATCRRLLSRKPGEALTRVFFQPQFLRHTAQAMKGEIDCVVACCVVPEKIPALRRYAQALTGKPPLLVSGQTDLGIGIRYPNKHQIGADRLANAVGVVNLYGAPAIVVDFGTAVTFDVINPASEYVGGVIAPGISAMTHYLHEHTALLPNITPHEPRSVVGKSTVEAMQVGTVVGYRGLVKEILHALRREPGLKKAVVVATGGYGGLIARRVAEIQHVNPLLTLEGLRFIYRHHAHESN